MWNWFNCYLSGRHEYGMWCEPGTIFLRCVHCGRRSSGWALDGKAARASITRPKAKALDPSTTAVQAVRRVIPFSRRIAS
jgi:hypothetical protein